MNDDKLIEKCLLTDEELGDLVDIASSHTYNCSDGSKTTTIDCRPISKAQLKKAIPTIRAEAIKELADDLIMWAGREFIDSFDLIQKLLPMSSGQALKKGEVK